MSYTNSDGGIYAYATNTDGNVTIVAYTGPPSVVTIPTNINNLTVTGVGDGGASLSNAAVFSARVVSVTIPASVASIGNSAFANCSNLTNVTILGNITSIGNYAFNYCVRLASVGMTGSVTNIGDYAFVGCASLAGFIIPNGTTRVGSYAFGSCRSLASVAIPESVTNIGANPFEDCAGLAAITVDTNNLYYSSVGGVLFDKSQFTLIACPSGLGGNYAIPFGVTKVETDAFNSCVNLTIVTIPESVVTIGQKAFAFCAKLTGIAIPESVTSMGPAVFWGYEPHPGGVSR